MRSHPLVRVSTDTSGEIRFGTFRLDLGSRELRDGEDSRRLTSQPFEILRVMLERPGEVITREELRRRLWPEGTFVDFDHSLNTAVRRLRTALGDNAGTPRFVETLPGRGYRFRGQRPPTPGLSGSAPRVAVLPLTNLGGGPADEQFVDGLTEELVAQLGLRAASSYELVATTASAALKRTMQRVRDAGTVLAADYVVEGSVRTHADRVRIVVRLAHTASETNRWSETYDHQRVDPLTVQHDVAVRMAASIAVMLAPNMPPSPAAAQTEARDAREVAPAGAPARAGTAWRPIAIMLATLIVWSLVFWLLYGAAQTIVPSGPDTSRGTWLANALDVERQPAPATGASPAGIIPAHRAHDSVRRMPVAKSMVGA
jgi:TolB-like protein/DNA-binding winged helix-turn-helix (wHTH) protein